MAEAAPKSESASYDKQRQRTESYLKDSKIQELLAHLLQLLVYHKPENPRQFLIDEVRKMQAKKSSDLFTDEDLATMFDMVDVTKQKSITTSQLRNACRNLSTSTREDGGVDESVIQKISHDGRVGVEEFKQVLGSQLRTTNHWA